MIFNILIQVTYTSVMVNKINNLVIYICTYICTYKFLWFLNISGWWKGNCYLVILYLENHRTSL